MSSSVDGLVSGLDTTSIITSLLQVDAAPQTALKKKMSTEQSEVTAYQGINTKMAALKTASENLQKSTAWSPMTATSSNTAVTATTTSTSTTAGSLTFDVTSLASARSVVSSATYASTTAVAPATGTAAAFPLDVVRGGKYLGTISPSTGSLQDMVSAINSAKDLGISAVAIHTGPNEYRLQIASSTTGSDGDFQLVASTGTRTKGDAVTDPEVNGFTQLKAASNATIDLGNGITASSSTNTFSDLMPGVTLTATAVASGVTVGVTKDTSTITSSVKAMVDAANDALNAIKTQSRAGTPTATGALTGGGVLAGDFTVRQLRDKILSSFSSAVGGKSLATVGVQLSSDGTVTFDQGKFLKNLAADPDGTKAILAPTSVFGNTDTGLSERLEAVGKSATDSVSGTLTTAIAGRNSDITDLTKRVSDWDTRLADKKARYQKYYSAMEVALGKLQSQSSQMQASLSRLE